ncbi:LVIVD repeat-containing protein [Novosphingobium sp. BL-52-GroH]|uniref:LVIVD repeat-containing protein n=1 Tax=Novosphingobium sp. BL-52-GroH TaxID=3349877 RepID=UPI00384C795F
MAQQPGVKPIALEKRSYIKDMRVLGHFFADSDRFGKFQMMSVGNKRYLFQAYTTHGEGGAITRGAVIDVSNPLKPVLLNGNAWQEGRYPGMFQIQVAYHQASGKWLLVAGSTHYRPGTPGFRGIIVYDLTDPAKPRQISRWSVDGGDPARAVQQGSGTHRFFYDGGRYAYLSTAPDDSYHFPELNGRKKISFGYSWGLQVVDLLDPAKPKLATNWSFPGQRHADAEGRKSWPFLSDPLSMPFQHGPVYMPVRAENGGRYGYGAWGSFGMVIQDLSDMANPRVVSTWRPTPSDGPMIAVHTVDVARLDRGFVITNPESILPQCREAQVPISIVDVRNPAKPTLIANLPQPVPPKSAPYKSYCERYGRSGPHNPPHLKAPGRADPNFTCYAYFAAGLQCYSLRDPRRPAIVSYFVPSQGTDDAVPEPAPGAAGEWTRTVDNVFIEWDRRLIWVATDSGIYLLSATQLGTPVTRPMPVTRWVMPDSNQGSTGQRPATQGS